MQDILLIHGMWLTGSCWQPFAGHLEHAGYRVHAPTLPLHDPGRLSAPPGLEKLRLADYVQAMDAFVENLALQSQPVVIGHSMGALVAQQLATRREFAALGLLAPVSPRQVQSLDARRAVITWKLLRRKGLNPAPHRPRARDLVRWMAPDLSQEGAEGLASALCWESGRVVFEMECWPLDWRGGNRVSPERAQVPVWVAGGAQDQMIQAHSVRRLAAWYDAPCKILPDVGHWLLDEPACGQVADAFLLWLASLQL